MRPRLAAAAAVLLSVLAATAGAQTVAPADSLLLLRPARVFDGMEIHDGWAVLVRGERIAAAGPAAQVGAPAGARVIDL
ncbi:MAG: amidohydrolase family protein, partial [Gemmatimonadaceae bacterium]|nr:amidohydrolase family protein [Gemmatimonadaceae bacterium]